MSFDLADAAIDGAMGVFALVIALGIGAAIQGWINDMAPECCGCSCAVCANGHDSSEDKRHTDECKDRFYARNHVDA